MRATILAGLLLIGSLAGCSWGNRTVQTGDLDAAKATIVATIHEECG